MRRVLALWVLCGGTSALAAPVDIELRGHDLEVPAQVAYDVVQVLGRVRGYLETKVGLPMRQDVPVRFLVVKDRDTYDRMAHDAGIRPGSGGFYNRRSGCVVYLSDPDHFRGLLVHEATHLLLRVADVHLPRWAHEGLAETFEGWRASGGAIWLDPDRRKLERMRRDADRLGITARTIVGSTTDTWDGMDLGNVWADHEFGGALVFFLLGTADGRRALRAVSLASNQADPTAGAVAAVDATYPGGLARLDEDFRAWWQGTPAPLQLPVRAAETTMAAPPSACPGVLVRRGTEEVCSTGR